MIRVPLNKRLIFLFSSKLGLIALGILAVCVLFVSSIIYRGDFLALQLSDESPTTVGWVDDWWHEYDTWGEVPLWEVHYAYSNPYGQELYHWHSYVSVDALPAKDSVVIQFLPDDPGISRIKGSTNFFLTDLEIQSSVGLAILLIIALVAATNHQISQLRVLKKGRVALGKPIRRKPLNYSYKDRKVYEIFFRYHLKDGQEMKSSIETHRMREVTDEEQELLVYDTHEPKRIVLVDDFPPYIRNFVRAAAEKEWKRQQDQLRL